MRRKVKSNDKNNGPSSPTIPTITFDSVFDDGRDQSQDTVYSTETSGSIDGFMDCQSSPQSAQASDFPYTFNSNHTVITVMICLTFIPLFSAHSKSNCSEKIR